MGKWIKAKNVWGIAVNGVFEKDSKKRWSFELSKMIDWHWVCNKCYYKIRFSDLRQNFCPFCGEKMSNPEKKRVKKFHESDRKDFVLYEEN